MTVEAHPAFACYNITNDKLFFRTEQRLSDEEYNQARQAGFAWWPGSKQFVCKWTPQSEDFILFLGLEILEDDTTDDVETRVSRFSSYAENATESADSRENYFASGRCNTERRQRLTEGALKRDLDRASYWNRRVEASITHAARKERPDVISRRIKILEAEKRRNERGRNEAQELLDIWNAPNLDAETAKKLAGLRWNLCESKSFDLPETVRNSVQRYGETVQYHGRWISHLENRIIYEKALFFAVGGIEETLTPVRKKATQPKGPCKTKNGKTVEKMGAVGIRAGFSRDGKIAWYIVSKVNRCTVEVYAKENRMDEKPRYYRFKKDAWEIEDAMTPDEVKAKMPELLEIHKAIEEILARRAVKKAEGNAGTVQTTETAA